MEIGDRGIIYLDKYGCVMTQPQDNREIEVEILVTDKDNPHEELFVCSVDLPNNFGIDINADCKTTWTNVPDNYNLIPNIEKYFGLRGEWLDAHLIFPSNKSMTQSVKGKSRNEKPCQHCNRMNDIGIDSCWWCCNKPF